MVERARGVKFCMHVGLLSGQVFSPFGEDWLAGSHRGGGITSGINIHSNYCLHAKCVFVQTNVEASGDGR